MTAEEEEKIFKSMNLNNNVPVRFENGIPISG